MTGFELNQASLLESSYDVRAASVRLRDDRDHVDRAVRGLLGTGWTGETADSFVDVWGAWRHGAQNVLDGLVALGELLAVTHDDYKQTDAVARRELAAVAEHLIARLG